MQNLSFVYIVSFLSSKFYIRICFEVCVLNAAISNFYVFKHPSILDTSKNFSWVGAGTAVFSRSPKQHISAKGAGDGNDSSGDEGCADDSANNSHDPHFEPIIDLPDTVEVRTGEEDETKGRY